MAMTPIRDDGDASKKYKNSFVLGDAIGKYFTYSPIHRGDTSEDAQGQER